MRRIQAQLPEATAQQLRELAAEEGVSVAELLRRGAERVIRDGTHDTPDERRRRARAVVGRFSDAPDVAARHDEHLSGAFGR